MRVINEIWLDVRERRNLDVYITVLVALVVTALSVFQVVQIAVVLSAVLAVLALVSVSLLVNRRENDELQEALSKVTPQPTRLSEVLQARSQLPSLEVRFAGAETIDVAGMSLLAISTSHYELLLKKARGGCRIRLLLLNPNNAALMSATCAFVVPLTADAHRQEISTSLNSLLSEPALLATGNVEIRLSDHPLAHGLLIVNAERDDGQMRVEIYLHGKKPTRTPGLTILKATDLELFDAFEKEYAAMWEVARPHPS